MESNSPTKKKLSDDENDSKIPKMIKTESPTQTDTKVSDPACSEKTSSCKDVKSESKVDENTNTLQEEQHFRKLFRKILDFLLKKHDVKDNEVTEAINKIREAFNYAKGNRFSDIDFSKWCNICGYLYRYIPHSTCLARNRVLNAVENCEDLKSKLHERELNVVSLGGSTGSDMIGFCSALYELRSCTNTTLNITVVDSVDGWKWSIYLVEFLIRSEDFGNVSKLFNERSVKLKLETMEVPEDSENYKKIVGDADIIIAARLITIMDFARQELAESLAKLMKRNALLVLIDSPCAVDVFDSFKIVSKSVCGDYVNSNTEKRFGQTEFKTTNAEVYVLQTRYTN